MTDEKRLAEIEARRRDILAEWECPVPRNDESQIVDDDVPWLIARIHALEAQAVLDAKVRETATAFLYAHDVAGGAFILRDSGRDWTPELARQANTRYALETALVACGRETKE